MGKTYNKLTDKLIDFIKAQKMFFVATAPRSDDGHVNVSPKGYDSLVVIDEETVAWLDLGGSGIETMAHLKENGRITIMFCAFEGPANIVRLYGKGEAVQFDDPRFPELLKLFPAFEKARAIVTVKLDRVSDSCGWGVPFYDFKGERDQLKRTWDHAYEKHGDAVDEKFFESNAESIDGLPGMTRSV
ncbi:MULTISPECIES: pyridoxamine 5'-phosphate oxidase family protein [Henriciella]|uniref:Pyridoxamine 5'-phosphate oxidase n=1 Tax=Henriciella pelagia TaxID=1977912 RepID=A0ABQ1JJ41_9PROT|nr:pyridoxamine 5'-phosphate oxidase family protein [Henriciella pelagia]GGB68459.1 pyridoxamine 5'-phosphate oxidase [Henriciella pelagia]